MGFQCISRIYKLGEQPVNKQVSWMLDTELLTFTLLVTLLTLTPGADTFILIRNVLRGGTRAGIATTLGGRLGLVIHANLSAFGVSAILAHSANAYFILKLLGAVYLVWLGFKSIYSSLKPQIESENKKESQTRQHPFSEGLLSNLLNPKTALFYLAVLPQFVSQEGSVLGSSIFLCSIHVGISLVWYIALSVGMGKAQALLKAPRFRRWIVGITGGLLTALGLRLGVDCFRSL